MSKSRILRAPRVYGALVFGALLLSVFSVGLVPQSAYAGVNSEGSSSRNQSEAQADANRFCTGGRPVTLAAWPDSMNFNESTGYLNYRLNIVYKTCSGGDTRSLAITGYPSPGGLITCPVAGWYHSGSAETRDCVKYTGSDLGHFGGYAQLSCNGYRNGYNYTCVNGGSSASGLFRSQVENTAKQPGTGFVLKRVSVTGSRVPDWNNRTRASGTYTFNHPDAVCTSFKWNSNGVQVPRDLCYGVRINVSWTRNWSVSTATSVDRTTMLPGQTATWSHRVTTGSVSPVAAGNYILTRYQNVNAAANATWKESPAKASWGMLKIASNTGWCVDVASGSRADGAKIRPYTCNESAAQMWRLENTNQRIRNSNSNKCLDVAGGGTANGTTVQLHSCNGSGAQRWVLISSGRLQNPQSGRCLDIPGGHLDTNASLRIYNCNTSNAQRFVPDWDNGTTGADAIRNMGSNATASYGSTYTATNADIGKDICRRTAATAASNTNGKFAWGPTRCVRVQSPTWAVGASVTPTGSTGSNRSPGQTIGFDWYVRNNGPANTHLEVDYVVKVVRYSNGSSTTQPSDTQLAGATALTNTSGAARQWSSSRPSGWGVGAANQATRTNDAYLRYTLTQADVNRWVCAVVYASPRAHNNSARVYSKTCRFIPYSWSVGASVTPTSGTGSRVAPGQTVGYDWYVRNNGPTNTSAQVNYVVKVVRYSNGSSTTPPSAAQLAGAAALTNTAGAARQWSSSRPSGWGVGSGNQATRTNDSLLRYTLTQNDVERWICAVVYASPSANNNSGRVYGSTCRYIPLDYSLIPKITSTNDNAILDVAQTNFDVEGTVTNNGPTRSATNIAWQITQLVYPPSATIANKAGGTGPNVPCTYFTGESSCSVIGQGTDATAYGDGTTRTKQGTANVTPDTYELGTRVCFVLSVKPHQDGSSDWRYSTMICQIMGKRPKVQVRGGDLLVGRGLDASGNKIRSVVATSVTAAKVGSQTRNYGSWSEYGILASGNVTRMASGSGYAGGVGTQSLCSGLSLLTFYNRTSTGSCNNNGIGRYDITSASPAAAMAAKFTSNGANISGNVNLSNIASGQVRQASGNVNLSSSADIPVGKWVVIKAPGRTVTISSNINYSNAPITSADRIPQVVIIAQNIYIAPNVTNVDAWLIATGTIRTCDQVTSANALRSTNCTNSLRVNGPVVTNRLELWRTAGAGAGEAAGDPAEVFNLRPDAYLWATAVQSGASKVQTATTKELPPRF